MPSVAPLKLEEVMAPEWLSWALSQRGEPVEVEQAEVIDTIGPSASNVRIKLKYRKAPADLPDALCIKGIFRPEMQLYIDGGSMSQETWFYQHVASNLTVTTPRHYYAQVDEKSLAGVIIMDDMIDRGASFMSVLSAYSPQEAEGSLDQLARLHAGTWGDKMQRYPWITSKTRTIMEIHPLRDKELTEVLHGPRGDRLPEKVRNGARVHAGMGALADRAATVERCMIHGDAHAGNLFKLADGQLGFLDWQVIQPESWSVDVAYHLGGALETEVRRAKEQDLLRLYLDRLAFHGGNPPDWDTAWELYRQSIAYGYWMWAVTQRVVPNIIEQFCQRLGQAVADHDTWERLGV